jgi:hypothetical protein
MHENGPKKKRPDKWVALAWAFQRLNDKQISQWGKVVEEKGNLLGIKRLNKKEKNYNWPPIAWRYQKVEI